jgi:hypothetical protein
MELIKTETIQHKIHTIREVQIILDKDLAQFYGVKPIRLREQIKRNPNRFPSDFVFPLSETEIEYMVSQNAIPSKQSLGGSFPLVFTEQGVGAVSGVIKSEKAGYKTSEATLRYSTDGSLIPASDILESLRVNE